MGRGWILKPGSFFLFLSLLIFLPKESCFGHDASPALDRSAATTAVDEDEATAASRVESAPMNPVVARFGTGFTGLPRLTGLRQNGFESAST